MSSTDAVIIILPDDGESLGSLLGRMRKAGPQVLLILTDRDNDLQAHPAQRRQVIDACMEMGPEAMLATKQPQLAAEARGRGVRVIDRTKLLRTMLRGHASYGAVLQVFSPHQWRQQLTSQLQRMGLLSVPKLRIYLLAGLSLLLFFFVVFRLLPSAEISIAPRQETASQTVNIYLVQSGASVNIPRKANVMALYPITVTAHKSIVSSHVSKKFSGQSAVMMMTIVNATADSYTLKKGTRFTNQAGMVFRIDESVTVPPKREQAVSAVADDMDQYGQIIGARGNLPAGVQWKIPGLTEAEQRFVYGVNKVAASGGATAYERIVSDDDLVLAKKKLEQELLAEAAKQVDTAVQTLNDGLPAASLVVLQPKKYPELTRLTYSGFSIPTDLKGKSDVASITASGEVTFTVYAYDAQAILDFLRGELRSHVRDGKALEEESLGLKRLVSHVIDYAPDLAWIKLTVDLSGTEVYLLDPLTPQGALFAKRVRERVAGLPVEEGLRIINNMPEVEEATISSWPPWSGKLPPIPSHISISVE